MQSNLKLFQLFLNFVSQSFDSLVLKFRILHLKMLKILAKKKLPNFFKNEGIKHETSRVYTPLENGLVKRKISHTWKNMGLYLLVSINLMKKLTSLKID